MEAANAVSTRAASSPLEATRSTVSRMAAAGGASTRAAPRQLNQAARSTARRTAAAGGASTRAAPRQSLKVPAVCTARYLSSACPTMRRICAAISRVTLFPLTRELLLLRGEAGAVASRARVVWVRRGVSGTDTSCAPSTTLRQIPVRRLFLKLIATTMPTSHPLSAPHPPRVHLSTQTLSPGTFASGTSWGVGLCLEIQENLASPFPELVTCRPMSSSAAPPLESISANGGASSGFARSVLQPLDLGSSPVLLGLYRKGK
jgi:hypothetical protein